MRKVKVFTKENIADGDSYEDTWTPTVDVYLRHIHINEHTSITLDASRFYLKIGPEVVTEPNAPAALFGPTELAPYEIDVYVPAKTTCEFKLVNKEGTTISVDIIFEYEPK